MFSVLILTHNEEINIQDCINSVSSSDDIVILDSFSSDKTTEIAEKNNVRIYQREFDNYAAQRNYALSEIEYKNKWLFMLDADERATRDFERELVEKLKNVPEDVSILRFRRKDIFQGRWLKRSSGYPTWFGRVLKIGSVKVEREINEEYHTDGNVEYLKEHILHYPFNKGIEYWIERHKRYSSMEAEYLTLGAAGQRIKLGNLFSQDPFVKRKVLKQILYQLPFRPFLVFIYLYIFSFGFLDGKAGYKFCRLRAMYERMIVVKMKEKKQRGRNNSSF
jgi:glycosyltransferase involved in cell wall biosynthesis